ncbi:MAG: hypothetical protein MR540_03000, partial [Clostridiales bacterium]|nr:hypothetical protein [Clostridiales bacterium]
NLACLPIPSQAQTESGGVGRRSKASILTRGGSRGGAKRCIRIPSQTVHLSYHSRGGLASRQTQMPRKTFFPAQIDNRPQTCYHALSKA